MKQVAVLIFSGIAYLIGLGSIIYYAAFLADWGVTKTINSGDAAPIVPTLAINLLLIVIFGLQHSVMARKPFKKWISRCIPAPSERSVYIVASSVALALLCWAWKPMPYELYDLRGSARGSLLYLLYGSGWFVGLFSTFLIDHFDLFGLKQAWHNWKGSGDFQYRFRTPLLYKLVRHPIYLGWLMIHWFTPHMTVGHLVLATGLTIYIYIAIGYEERDLVTEFGDRYRSYQQNTPKLIPVLGQTKNKKGSKE